MNHGSLSLLAALLITTNVWAGPSSQDASVAAQNRGIAKFLEGNLAGAANEFQLAVKVDSTNDLAWYNLGQVEVTRARHDAAAHAFAKAATLVPKDPMYRYKLGVAQFKLGRLVQAEGSLKKSLVLEPRLYRAQTVLGDVLLARGNANAAAHAWTRAATLNPMFGQPFIKLGQLYFRWQKYAACEAVIGQGLINVLDPRERSHMFHVLGLVRDEQGEHRLAIAQFDQALIHDPNNTASRLQRGVAYASVGSKKKALADLEAYVAGGGPAFEIQAANALIMRLRRRP